LTRGKLAATFRAVNDYGMDDLVRLTGYSGRGIRHYIQNHLIPRPKFSGSATRYPRETLGRLAVIRAWRREGMSIYWVKRNLKGLTAEELELWACDLDPPEGALPEATVQEREIAPGRSLTTAEQWSRVPIAAGLDLMMRNDAPDAVVQLAQEIQAKYGIRTGIVTLDE
jgi:DNA-binding transcriptional MerR regulator